MCVFRSSQTSHIVSKASKIAHSGLSTFLYGLTRGCGGVSRGFSKPQTPNKVWPVTWEAKLISLFLRRFVQSESPLYVVGLDMVGILLGDYDGCSINSKSFNSTSKLMISSSDKLASFNSKPEALEELSCLELDLARSSCCAKNWQLHFDFLPVWYTVFKS